MGEEPEQLEDGLIGDSTASSDFDGPSSRAQVEGLSLAVEPLGAKNSAEPIAEDSFPEEREYQDDGCDLFPSCLNCPLPVCRYDELGRRVHWAKRLRDREVLRSYNIEGTSIKELARRFGLSQRTVYRIIRRASS